ncbi:flagellar basal body L-ring protein FlgH [Buchnera aphidicola (Ceratovacuna keduensis)]|uniref:flagellar basal body L-ring protein FlgH n=1 Tax=Buchnera aphidicola TaxID=9 RepID=UPI0031B8971D
MKNTKFLIPILIYILFKTYSLNNSNENNILEKRNSAYKNIKDDTYGSIFEENNITEKKNSSLFEQEKKYKVGDLISILIQENTIATNRTAENTKRYASSLLGNKEKKYENNRLTMILKNFFRLNQKSENNLFGSGQNISENFLSGIITVTVKQILPNENLLVSGTKNIVINRGNETIKFSGIINPDNIKKNNKIISTRVADIKVEYFRNDYIKDIEKMGWWQRFILHVIPI